MTRRWFLAALAAASLVNMGQAADPPTGLASLEETLNYGLRPRTPDDKAFIQLVISKVEAKELPLELVIATYRWSLNKRPYPYPYFERALRARAKAIGTEL